MLIIRHPETDPLLSQDRPPSVPFFLIANFGENMKTKKQNSNTPLRTFRVPELDWREWQDRAASEGKTLSDWLRSLARNEIQKQQGEAKRLHS